MCACFHNEQNLSALLHLALPAEDRGHGRDQIGAGRDFVPDRRFRDLPCFPAIRRHDQHDQHPP